jgi:inner membrane protein
MYAAGHYGVSLLAYAPVGAALVSSGRPDLAVVGGAVVLWLATLPDVDHRLPLVEHRGVTHTPVFALAVGAVVGAVAFAGATLAPALLGTPLEAAAFGAFVGTYGVLAHLLGDVVTPSGVPLLWPLSGRDFTLSLWTAKNRVANYGLFALGLFVTAGTVVGLGLG